MIARIHWAMLAVADQDAMIEFCVRGLGFEKRTDGEMWPGARWVEVVPPGERTGLVLSPAAAFDREPMAEYPMGFSCADLRETVRELRERGIEVTDPVDEPWGRYVAVTDPEGRELLVNENG